MKTFLRLLAFFLFLLGCFGVMTACAFQIVLVFQYYGVIGANGYAVKHWAMWLWLSILLWIPSIIIYKKTGDL